MASVVGTCAVVLEVGAGGAAEADVLSGLLNADARTVTIRSKPFVSEGRRAKRDGLGPPLTSLDSGQLRDAIVGVDGIAGIAYTSKMAVLGQRKVTAGVVGVDWEYFRMRPISLRSGRYFTSEEAENLARVAVVGSRLAVQLSGGQDLTGETLRVGGNPFLVVGVSSRQGRGQQGEDLDNTLTIPLKTLLVRVLHRDRLDGILIQAKPSVSLRDLRTEIALQLGQRHGVEVGKPDNFEIVDPVIHRGIQQDTRGAFRALLSGIAVMALLTGSIGIASVMLVAVRERAREVGVRRAIGATRGAILIQFLLESTFLSTIGGVCGSVLGLCGNYVISRVSGWPLTWPLLVALSVAGLSILLGVVSGIVPAVRAACLQPASAMRS